MRGQPKPWHVPPALGCIKVSRRAFVLLVPALRIAAAVRCKNEASPRGRGTVAISADGLKVGTSTGNYGPTCSVSDGDRTGFCM
jgi:hypothetical protein